MLIKKTCMINTDTKTYGLCSNQLILFYFSDTVGCIAFITLYIRLVKYVGHQFFVLYRRGSILL